MQLFLDLVNFVVCTLVSRDCVHVYDNMKCPLYPGNQGTHEKLIQIHFFVFDYNMAFEGISIMVNGIFIFRTLL